MFVNIIINNIYIIYIIYKHARRNPNPAPRFIRSIILRCVQNDVLLKILQILKLKRIGVMLSNPHILQADLSLTRQDLV